MQDNLVSVLIPAYNAAAFIGETLRSIQRQTHSALEIIVVDDGSTDDTPAIVRSVAEQDSRVRLISGAHLGVPATRNRAASFASGLYLAPCDSDDLWHPRKIELQLAALLGHANTGVSYCWSVGINEASEIIFPNWARHTAEGNVLYKTMEDCLAGSGSAILVRRSCFDAVGGFPERVPHGDEWQICIALSGITQFAAVSEYLVAYRLRSGSTSSSFSDVELSLQETTNWITEAWPGIPRQVMSRRAYTIYCYLSFLALRSHKYRKALIYRGRALANRPTEIVSVATLSFALIVFAQLLGIQRYYYAFWKKPRRWEGAPPKASESFHVAMR